MNYTKGEWKVEIIESKFPKHHKVYARIRPSIGYVGWDDMGVYDEPGFGNRQLKTLSQEALANAYLVAAAPDMYEALKKVAEIEQVAGKVCAVCGGYLDHKKDCLIPLAEKAISKAEGRTNDEH